MDNQEEFTHNFTTYLEATYYWASFDSIGVASSATRVVASGFQEEHCFHITMVAGLQEFIKKMVRFS